MRRNPSSLLLVVVLALATSVPVSAAGPATEVEELDLSFVLPGMSQACGFPVTMTVLGRVSHKTWVDENGDVIREIHNINLSRTVSANGNTLSFKDSGADRLAANEDGSTTIETVGNLGLVTVSGSGPALGAAGRTVILLTPVLDEEGNAVLDEEGNPLQIEEVLAETGLRPEDIAAVCAALAG